jgi:hypothetical protein
MYNEGRPTCLIAVLGRDRRFTRRNNSRKSSGRVGSANRPGRRQGRGRRSLDKDRCGRLDDHITLESRKTFHQPGGGLSLLKFNRKGD